MTRRPRGDDGTTILELIVVMTVLSIFFSVFTGAVVSIYRSANHSEGVARTTEAISQAFGRLDSQVRYTSYISAPGQAAGDGGNWYVELEDTNHDPARCIQLRVDRASGQLQQRSWSGAGPSSAWLPIATGVLNSAATGADAPFQRTAPTPSTPMASLVVNLITSYGTGANAASSRTQIRFTALNTTVDSPDSGQCAGRRP